jgi:hypothetical protein
MKAPSSPSYSKNSRTRFIAGLRRLGTIYAATFCLLMLSSVASAQLSGPKSIPGDYATLAAAITDLNTQGVGAGGVTFTVADGYTETAPVGGFSITTLTGTVANQIIFQRGGGGAKPSFTANPGLTAGALNDAIFKIIGGDYITINGLEMRENTANTITTAASNNMTEFGVALFYTSTTDGAQNNTIQNCTIDLDRTYQNTFGIYSNSTHSATSVTVSATATGAAGGNSGLKIYGNTITDVNIGIVVVGPTAAADNNDGLDIGGASLATGNSVTNYGTTGTFSGYANVSGTVNGILVRNTKNFNVSFNTVASSNGGTTAGTLRGIYVPSFTNAPTGTFTNTINNNNVSVRSAVATGTMNGILVESTTNSATSTLNINNNDFNTITHTVAASGTIFLISNASTALNQTFNNNTFTNLSVNTTGSVTFISSSITLPAGGTQSVDSNSIVTAFNKTGAGGTVTFFTNNGSSPAGTTEANNNNNFSNVTVTGATVIAGWSSTDGGAPTKTVTGNVFSNIVGGTSPVTGMAVSFSGSSNVSNNTVSNISSASTITGITTGSGIDSFSQNTVYTLATTGASAVTGIAVTSGTTKNVFKNKIYDLQSNNAAGQVNGVTVSAGTTVTVYDNLIGDLRAPSTNAVIDAIKGINLTSSTASSTLNIYYNTIYLNATSSGAFFNTAGVFHTASATATTAALSLRNNTIVNTSTANGTGTTVAYRRSLGTAGTLANYASSSNNNDFYAGTPGPSNLIYSDGTSSAQTIAAYKNGAFTAGTIAPRDSASFTENPPFLSTTGSSANFLHISSVVATQLESGAAPVGGITDDFDGDTRNVSTPDVGADEFNGILLDLSPPVISYTLLGNGVVAGSRSFTNVAVTDASGVNTTAGTRPRVYYKKSSDAANTFNDNTSGTAGWKFVQASGGGGSPFSFTIDYSLLFGGGGVSVGDTIQYFVVAQDLAPTPNVGINSGTFAMQPSSVALTSAAFPIGPTINSYLISAPISGTKTVCASGCDYTTLTGATGIFNAINIDVATGNIEIQIAGDLTIGEDGTNGLNVLSEEPSGSNFTVKIYPTGSARAITGSFNGALIRLNGSSRVTIDGSIGGTGTDRSLTIQNTSVTTPSVVLLGSTGTTPITNDTLKNCIVRNGVNTSSAVVISDAGTLGNPGFFSNITIQNNDVQKAFVGVYATGGTSPQNGSNLTYTQNTVNTTGANAVRNVGLYMQGVNGATVSQNTVGNLDKTNDENDVGIWLASGTINATVSGNTVATLGYTGTSGFAPIGINVTPATTATNNNVTGNSVTDISTNGSTTVRGIAVTGTAADLTIQKNNVQGIINSNTGTFGVYGIDISGGNNVVVKNNFVSNVNHDMTGGAAFSTTFGVFGIRVGSGTGIQVYNNSVNLYGLSPGTANTSLLSAAFALVGTTSTGCDVRNNIFANNITGGTTSVANVSAYLPSGGTSAMNLTWNNNAYFYGTDAARQGVGQAGTTAGTNFFTTLAALAAYSSTLSVAATNDNASIASTGAVPYLTNNDLHITPSAGAILGGGAAVGSVTNDFDMDPRPALMPDIGADELVQAVGGVIPSGTLYNASTADGDTLGGNVTITNTLYLNGKLNTGASAVTINCGGTVVGGGASNYIIGNLKKNFCATGAQTFEVGTANGFSPVDVNITAGTFPALFHVNAVQGPQPNIVNPAAALKRYWTLSGTGLTADLTFHYLDPIDLPTAVNENQMVILKYDGSFSQPGGSVNAAADTATITGVTSFSDWTLAGPNAPTAAPATISGRVTTPDGSPLGGATIFLSGNASARTITNGDGRYRFDNVPTEAFYTVTPALVNYSFSPASRSFSLMGNQTDVGFTANATAATGNPLNVVDFFVRQQYLDFLGREPDMGGWLYWTSEINACGNNQLCINQRRIDVSAAFFASEEFQQTGSFIYRLYQTGLGRQLSYGEFTADRPRVLAGPDLEENRAAFALEFVTRPEFTLKYQNATSADAFVDSLLATVLQSSGLDLSAQREALLAEYSQGADMNHSRSRVLRTLADNSAITDAAYNPSFVLMEYFGYLRRDIDQGGYEYWLDVLNHGATGNYRGMVCAFLTSTEYQLRFSPVVTHSNAECGP